MLLLKILGGLVALGIGIWLGRPGHYDRGASDIDELIDRQARDASPPDRHFTPLPVKQWKGTSQLRSRGASFRLRSPDE
jgi:hypothetical protein